MCILCGVDFIATRQKDSETTSAALGFRLAGMQVVSPIPDLILWYQWFLSQWVSMHEIHVLELCLIYGLQKTDAFAIFVGVQVSKCNSVESAPYLVQEDNCRWCTCSIRALRFIESLWRTKLGRCICIWCLWRNSWCYCTASGAQGMVCIRLVSKHSSIILLNLVDPGIFTWNVLDLQLMS